MLHRLTQSLARLLLSCFYRRLQVSGADRIPPTAPLVVCANHNGALIDPLCLLATIGRPLRPLAKAPLFQVPVLGPILRAVGALPVYRPQDQHLVRGSNAGLAAAARAALGRGEAILVFPEGISKPQPTLSKLRPGAARFALEAEFENDWKLGALLLPVGIHIEDGSAFRRGRIFVEVGEPIPASDLRAAYSISPTAAIDALLDRLADALRSLIVEVDSVEELRLLRLAARAWAAERGLDPLDDPTDAELVRAFGRGYRALRDTDPSALPALRVAAETYSDTLERFGLTGRELDVRHSLGSVAWFSLRELTALVVGGPIGLAGATANLPPRAVVALLTARLLMDRDSWLSLQLGIAAAAFPLYWLAVAAGVGLWLGPGWGMVALAALPLGGWWGLRFREHRARLRGEVRGFLLLAGGGGLRRQLGAQRRAIHDQVEAVRSRVVPPAP